MTADEAEAWSRLSFHLENQIGFWFALVVGDDARPRARLRDQAERWCREQGKPFFVHAPPPHSLARLAVELAGETEPGIHWIRTDGPGGLIEEWAGAASQLFLAMNERREAYRKRLDGGVIVEGRESLKRLLRDLAPDLFSIRAFIAEPGTSAEVSAPRVPEWRAPMRTSMISFAVLADPDRELKRAERLEAATSPNAKGARRRALEAAAWGLFMAGRVEEAERCAHTLAREHGGGASHPIDELLLNALHGLIAWEQGRLELSLHRLDGVLCALRREDAAATAAGLGMLDRVLGLRGQVLATQGDLRSAEAAFREQLDALATLARVDPTDQDTQLRTSIVRRQIAALISTRGDHAAAEQMLHEGLGLVQRRATEHPTEARWQVELLEYHYELSTTLRARGDLAKAGEACDAALQIALQLSDDDGGERWSFVRWRLLAQRSAIASAQRDPTAALEWAQRSTTSALRLLAEHPDDLSHSWRVALGYGRQTDAFLQQGDLNGATAALLSAWNHARNLPLHSAQMQAARLLVPLHVQLGLKWFASHGGARAAGAASDGPRSSATRWARQAAGFLKRAIRLGERYAAVVPDDLSIRSLVDSAFELLALTLAQQGKHRQARQVRRRRRKLRRQWRRARP
ncbi:hypothetical protein [Sorangium atrum]|uniref:MalT-like TPR region domain-containing protein n=1 Tax=Sorangium atrum TaxID=2995308 RepID=A0ABT5CDM3_9BACT|nr:hypothetical protein [Sorangium aterium]MDC0683227.1 hypothetical protein [Sorangium aterium]